MKALSMNAHNHVWWLWQRLGSHGLGRWLFSLCLAWLVPYSGSIAARVIALQPGYAVVALREHRAVRNHLNCIYAIALANLGELASGLAMLAALPAGTKAIVTRLDIEFIKKARGELRAEGFAAPPTSIGEPSQHTVRADIKDRDGDVVAIVQVIWQLKAVADMA